MKTREESRAEYLAALKAHLPNNAEGFEVGGRWWLMADCFAERVSTLSAELWALVTPLDTSWQEGVPC